MGRLSQKWKLGHLVVVDRCIICTAYVPLCSAWNTSLLLSVHYTKNWRMHKFSPNWYSKYTYYIMYIFVFYIFWWCYKCMIAAGHCVRAMNGKSIPSPFLWGKGKRQINSRATSENNMVTQITSQVSNLEETRKSWSGRNVLGGWG